MSLIKQLDQQHVWHPFTQMMHANDIIPVERAKDCTLFTEDGRAILDAVSSWWVNAHGHSNEYIAKKVYEQMCQLEHVIFAGFTHKPAALLAQRLINVLPSKQEKVFFSDNGSTSVEVAIKMAIQYFHNKGEERDSIIAFKKGYHGDTFGAMSVAGENEFFNVFNRFQFPIHQIENPAENPEECLAELKHILATKKPIAIVYEPLVMGSAGMLMYAPELLNQILTLCKEQGVLCIADEVMTGFFRTGTWFASHQLDTQPDLMCLSKCLTGGFMPMGITTCTQEIFDAFLSSDHKNTFFHGHSYTGNPTACAAALASLDLFERNETQENIKQIVALHQSFSAQLISEFDNITIRQTGTILAISFGAKADYFDSLRDELYQFFLGKQILMRPLGNVIYILPPFCITEAELSIIYHAISAACVKFATQ
jgi:adenosylmethionine-8-amino-7-oxononanoate aminotransferase